MKKSIISLIGALVLILNMMVYPAVFAEDADIVNDFETADFIGSEKFATAKNLGFDILQNEKYVLIAEGTKSGITSNKDIHLNDKIHIYEKPNSEHLDYKFLTTIKQDSNNGSYDLPARDIYLYEDTLFVFWGNGLHTKNTAGVYSSCGKINPLKAYDLSDLEPGDEPVGTNISTGEQRTVTHAPFIRGGISYVDAEGGKLYHGSVMNASYGRREYYMKDLSAPTVNEKTFCTDAQSKNAVQFVVKDGYLYEMLQQKAGNGDFKSVDNTLVDADGNPLNNTIAIYDIEEGMKICAATGYTSIAKYKRGVYTTETAGDFVMQDIEVSGDYVYIATTNGLEVVSAYPAKNSDSLETLVLEERISEGVNINGIYINGNDLYAGTDNGMVIYDITGGIPEEKACYNYEGGFCDFEVNEDENAIYALLNGAKGAVIIDKAVIDLSVNVSGFNFSNNGLAFSANVSAEKDTAFKAIFLLYKGNKLIDYKVSEWTAGSDAVLVSDAFENTDAKEIISKVIFVKADDITKVIPQVSENGTVYKQQYGTEDEAAGIYDSSVTVSDIDENGIVTVSGNLSDRKSKPVLVIAKNENSDRLDGIRYFDVLNVSEDGDYKTQFKPADSGVYSVNLYRVAGYGVSNIENIEVPALTVTVPNAVEIPGVTALMVVNMENAQNVETIDAIVSFDGDSFTADENVEVADEFSLVSAEAAHGGLKLSLAKKNDIKKADFEAFVITTDISESAALGNYSWDVTVIAKDESGNVLEADTNSGNLELVVSTPKYDALDAAKAALKLLKKADEINVDNYLDEKAKVEDARTKVDYAYTYFVRDSQLGEDMVLNLADCEEKLLEIKPYYDKVDELNSAASEDVGKIIEENRETFGISKEAIDFYKEIEDTTEIDDELANETFKKPSDIKISFCEKVCLESFKTANWQIAGDLLDLVKDSEDIDFTEYEKLTYEQKTYVFKELDMKEYKDIKELSAALDKAVDNAKEQGSTNNSGSSRPSGGGGSRGGGSSIYLTPQPESTYEPVKEDKEDKVFKDTENFAWAENAIVYLYEKGIVNGKAEGIFAPSDNVTREEFAKMVCLAFGISESGETSFTDVKDDSWYAEFVKALSSAGIVGGRGDGTFGTGENITRQDLAVILERALAYKGIELESGILSFNDNDDISEYAVSAISKMCASGVISGFPDGSVRPKESASRAQVAKVIYTILTSVK